MAPYFDSRALRKTSIPAKTSSTSSSGTSTSRRFLPASGERTLASAPGLGSGALGAACLGPSLKGSLNAMNPPLMLLCGLMDRYFQKFALPEKLLRVQLAPEPSFLVTPGRRRPGHSVFSGGFDRVFDYV